MATNKEAIVSSPSGRVRRTPVGVRNVLTVAGKDPAYEYRILNDTGDRVQQFLDAGYEIVKASDVRVGDKRVNKASAEGSVAQVSVGGGMKGMVVRIKREWYNEDQDAKIRNVAETEAATKQTAIKGSDYGEIKIT